LIKILLKILLLSVLAVAMIGLMVPSVFAEHSRNATVENAEGSSTPGCEPDCFLPATITIGVGGHVIFVNNDTAAHTSTSGTPANGLNGVWDSSLVVMGAAYTTPALDAGEYPYFCMVHPWMIGLVIVGSKNDVSNDPPSVNNSRSNDVGTFHINQNVFFQGETNTL
jgi:plastocyanin